MKLALPAAACPLCGPPGVGAAQGAAQGAAVRPVLPEKSVLQGVPDGSALCVPEADQGQGRDLRGQGLSRPLRSLQSERRRWARGFGCHRMALWPVAASGSRAGASPGLPPAQGSAGAVLGLRLSVTRSIPFLSCLSSQSSISVRRWHPRSLPSPWTDHGLGSPVFWPLFSCVSGSFLSPMSHVQSVAVGSPDVSHLGGSSLRSSS